MLLTIGRPLQHQHPTILMLIDFQRVLLLVLQIDYGFLSPSCSQFFCMASPTQIYTLSFSLSLKYKLAPKITINNNNNNRITSNKKYQKQTTPQNVIALVIYCWTWGLTLNVVYITSETSVEKNIFSLGSSNRLELLLGQGCGLMPASPLCSGTRSDLNVSRPCTHC